MDNSIDPAESPVSSKRGFACGTCSKQFDRADHLRRHAESHKNTRAFKCFSCGKGYNRRDLLTRHYAIHETEAPGGSRRAARAERACRSCAASKLKCDNERPCKRCRTTCRPCLRSDSVHTGDQEDMTPPASAQVPQLPGDSSPILDSQNADPPLIPPNATDPSGEVGFDPPELDGLNQLDAPYGPFDYPAYFDYIMLPETILATGDTGTFQPMLEFGAVTSASDSANDAVVIGDIDFSSFWSPAKQVEGVAREGNPQGQALQDSSTQEVTRARLEAFKRSPWLWMPSSHQSAFDEQSCLSIDQTSVDLAASPEKPRGQDIEFNDAMSSQSRDRMLLLINDTARGRLIISNFPAPDFLDTLVKTCILKRTRVDAWLHTGTFRCNTARPELLTALVAGGCVCFGISNVSQMGLLLQEIVRLSLERKFEADNSVIRDLQYLQAYMLWVDLGITCGIKRKMEIADSRLQPLCTALRRAGAFDGSTHEQIVPSWQDGDDSLEGKWSAWAQQESFRRLAYYALEFDSKLALLLNRPPLISYAELTAHLPCSMDLWLAESAKEWRNITLGVRAQESVSFSWSLRELITTPELALSIPATLDESRARCLLLSGLAGQVWEVKQQLLTTGTEHSSAYLWVRSRSADLAQRIEATGKHQETPASEQLFQNFLLMCLHVNVEDLQRFAGKNGEEEARRAYRSLEPWSRCKDGRTALWHAAQIFRVGRSISPYQFRGFDSIAVYHATLVLWVYGVLKGAEERYGLSASLDTFQSQNTGGANRLSLFPARSIESNYGDMDQTCVFLDGPKNASVQRFVELGRGRPGLTIDSETQKLHINGSRLELNGHNARFCDLRKSNLVMAVGCGVLDQNLPGIPRYRRGGRPPLVESLRDLMTELGRLPGHSEIMAT